MDLRARLDHALADLQQAHAHLSDLRSEPYSAFAVNARLQKTVGELKGEVEQHLFANVKLRELLEEADDARVATAHQERLATKKLRDAERENALLVAQRVRDDERLRLVEAEREAVTLRLAHVEIENRNLIVSLDAIEAQLHKTTTDTTENASDNRPQQPQSQQLWCSNCANLIRMNEEDHHADFLRIKETKEDLMRKNAALAALETSVAHVQESLKHEQDAHLATAHQLSEARAAMSSLKLENQQSLQNMKTYMKYSEEQQHLLISHIERMQSFSNRRADDSAILLSKTRTEFIETLRAMKDLSTVVWLTEKQHQPSASNIPPPSKSSTQILRQLETKLDTISASMKTILETVLSNAFDTQSLENAQPTPVMFKRGGGGIGGVGAHSASSLSFFASSENISTPVSTLFSEPARSLMKRIGSTLGVSGAETSYSAVGVAGGSALARLGLRPTDSDLNMESLSDLEEDGVSETEEGTGVSSSRNLLLSKDATFPHVLASIKHAKLDKLDKVISEKDGEIDRLEKEVERFKGVLEQVGSKMDAGEGGVDCGTEKRKQQEEAELDMEAKEGALLSLEWKSRMLAFEKTEMASKITSLQSRIESLQQQGLKSKSELDTKCVELERSDMALNEAKLQLKQSQLKLEATESLCQTIRTESETLKKRMSAALKKIEGKTLELVTFQLNNETAPSPSNTTPTTPGSSIFSSLAQSLSPGSATEFPATYASRLLLEKDTENTLLRTQLDKVNARVAENMRKIRELDARLLQSTTEVDRVKGIQETCTALERECERVTAESVAAAAKAGQLEEELKRRELNGGDVGALRSSLVHVTLELESSIHVLSVEKKALEEEVEKRGLEVEKWKKKTQASAATVSEKEGKINELGKLISIVQAKANAMESAAATKNEKIGGLEAKMKELMNGKSEVTEELQKCQMDLEASLQLTTSLQSTIATLESTIAAKLLFARNLEQLNASLTAENKSILSNFERSSRELDSVSSQLSQVQGLFSEKDAKSGEFMRQLSAYQSDVMTLQITCAEKDLKLQSLEELLEAAKGEKKSVAGELEKRMTELSVLHSKTLAHQANLNSLETALSEKDRKLKAAEAQLVSLHAEKRSLLEESTLRAVKLEAHLKEMVTLQQLLKEKTSKVEELLAISSEQQATVLRLEALVQEKEAQFKSLNVLIQKLEGEKKAMGVQLDALLAENGSLQQQIHFTSQALSAAKSLSNDEGVRANSQINALISERAAVVDQLSAKSKLSETLQQELVVAQETRCEREAAWAEVSSQLSTSLSRLKSLESTLMDKEVASKALEEKLRTVTGKNNRAVAKLDDKLAEIDSLQSKMVAYQTVIKSLESAASEKDDRIRVLDARVLTLTREADVLSTDVSTKAFEIDGLRKELESIQSLLSQKSVKSAEFVDQLSAYQSRVQSLESAVMEKDAQVKTVEQRVSDLSEEKVRVEQELAEVAAGSDAFLKELDSLKRVVGEKNEEAAELALKVATYQGNVTSLETRLLEKDSKLESLDSTVSKMLLDKKTLTGDLGRCRDDNLSLSERLVEHAEIVKSLEALALEKDSQLKSFDARVSALAIKKCSISDDLAAKHQEVEALAVELVSLRKARTMEVSALVDQVSLLKRQLVEREAAVESLRGTVVGVEEKLVGVSDERDSVVARLNVSLNDNKTLTSDLERFRVENSSLCEQVNANSPPSFLNAKLIFHFEMQLVDHAEITKSLEALAFEKDSLLKSLNTRASALAAQNGSISEDLAAKHQEVESLAVELASLRKTMDASASSKDNEIVSHVSKISALGKEVVELRSVIQQLEVALRGVSEERNSADAEVKALREIHDQSRRKLAEKTMEVSVLVDQVSLLEQQLIERKAAVESLRGVVVDLEENLKGMQELLPEKSSKAPVLVEQISLLKSQLSDRDDVVKSLRGDVDGLHETLKILNLEFSKSVSSSAAELSSFAIKLQAKEAECETLTREVQAHLKFLTQLQQRPPPTLQEDSADEKDELRRKLLELTSSCESLEFKLRSKEAEASTLELNFHQIATENQDIMAMVDKIKTDKAKSDALIQQLRGENSSLASRLGVQDSELLVLKESFESIHFDVKSDLDKFELANAEISKLRSQVRVLESEKTALETRMVGHDGSFHGRLEKQESDVAVLKEALSSSLLFNAGSDALELNAKSLTAANALMDKLKEEAVKHELLVKDLKDENVRVRKGFEGLQGEHQSLIESRENLWVNLNSKLSELKLARDEIVRLEQGNVKLSMDGRALAEECSLLRQMKSDSNKYKQLLASLESDHEALKETLETVELSLVSKSRQLQLATDENQTVVETSNKLVSEINQLVSERSLLREEMAGWRAETEEYARSLVEEIERLTTRLKSVESENLSSSERLKRSSSEIDGRAQEIALLSAERSLLDEAYSKLSSDSKLLTLEMEYIKKERDQLKLDLGQLSTVYTNSEVAASEYLKFVTVLDQRNVELLKLQSSLTQTELERNQLQESLEKAISGRDASVARLGETVARLEEDLVKMKTDCGLIVDENEQYMLLLNDYKIEKARLKGLVVSLESQKSVAETNALEAQRELLSLKEAVSSLTAQYERSLAEAAEGSANCSRLTQAVSDLKTDAGIAKGETLSLLREKDDLKLELARLSEVVTANSILEANNARLVRLLEERKVEVVDLQSRLQGLMDGLINRHDSDSMALVVCEQQNAELKGRLADATNKWFMFEREIAATLKLGAFDASRVLVEAKNLRNQVDQLEKDLKTLSGRVSLSQEEKDVLLAKEREKSRQLQKRVLELETSIDQLNSDLRIKSRKLESTTTSLQSQLIQKNEEAKSLEEQLKFEISNRPTTNPLSSFVPIDSHIKKGVPLRSCGTQSDIVCKTDAFSETGLAANSRGTQTITTSADHQQTRALNRDVDLMELVVAETKPFENKVMVDLIAEVSQRQGRIRVLEEEVVRLKAEKKEMSSAIQSRSKEAAQIMKELDTARLFKDSAVSESFSLRNKLVELQKVKESEVDSHYDMSTVSALMLIFQQVVNAQYSLSDYMELMLVSTSSENKELRLVSYRYDALLKEAEKLHAACDNWSQSYNELRLESNDAVEIKVGEINDLKNVISQKEAEIEALRYSNAHMSQVLKDSEELHAAKTNELKLIISESDVSYKAKLQVLMEDVARWRNERDTLELKFNESERRATQLSKEWDDSFMHLRQLAVKEKEAMTAEYGGVVAKLEERLGRDVSMLTAEVSGLRSLRDDLATRLAASETRLSEVQKEMDHSVSKVRKSLEKEAMALRLEKKKSESLHSIIQADREKNAVLQNHLDEQTLRAQTLVASVTTLTSAEQVLKKQAAFLTSEKDSCAKELVLMKRQLDSRAKRYAESETYLRNQLADARDEFHRKEMQWVADQSRLEQHKGALSQTCDLSLSEYQQLLADKNNLEDQLRVLKDTLALKSTEWSLAVAELNDQLTNEREVSKERDVQLVALLHSDGQTDEIEQIRRVSQVEKENASLQVKVGDLSASEAQLRRQLLILETDLRTSGLEWDQERSSLEEQMSTMMSVSRQQVEGLQASLNASYLQFQQKESQWLIVEKELHERIAFESEERESADSEIYRLTGVANSLEFEISNCETKKQGLQSRLHHLEKLVDIDRQKFNSLAHENTDLRAQLSASQDYIKTLERTPSTIPRSPLRTSELLSNMREVRDTADALVSQKSVVSIGTQTARNAVNRSSMTTSDLLESYKPPKILDLDTLDTLSKIETGSSVASSDSRRLLPPKSVSFIEELVEEEHNVETIIFYEGSANGENISRIRREIEAMHAKRDHFRHKNQESLNSFYENQALQSPTDSSGSFGVFLRESPTESADDSHLDFIKAATKRSLIGTADRVETMINKKK
ncbi:hypothetical protein HDU98_006042 [Podochytrium sp. JEL0797]|nr:hypothetical protein HDU98_006042 [Podochytrium sp. JEL0797]